MKGRVPQVIPRRSAVAQAFARWGDSKGIVLPIGLGDRVEAPQLVNAQSPTPAVWTVCLLASADARVLAGMTVAVDFQIGIGVGSTRIALVRTLVLAVGTPVVDLQIPFLPSGLVTIVAGATPNIVALRQVDVSVSALVTPFGASGFEEFC